MREKIRSLAGLAIAAACLPAFLGLMACLPVPIGDPEKSRIDPALSGLWLHTADGDVAVTLFEPFDDRSWLVSLYGLEDRGPGCADAGAPGGTTGDAAARGYDDWVRVFEATGSDCYEVSERGIYKAWLTRFGDLRLMTWEPRGAYDAEYGFGTSYWFVFRVETSGPDRVVQTLIDFEHEALDAVLDSEAVQALEDAGPPFDPRALRKARRAVERVIRRHAGDPELFDADLAWRFDRVRPEHVDLFLAPLADVLPDYE